ncbi:MAG: class I SAM-dependent rRNA methyltransferase [Spirochaetales bacterium]|nr:class I SAM-dependent rRNA methyltransferase [Spirochaetales bacterium]
MEKLSDVFIIKEKAPYLLKFKHPWIYSRTLSGIDGNPQNGDLVSVRGGDKELLGYGFFSSDSQIKVRMVEFTSRLPEDGWLYQSIKKAAEFRESLNLDTNACRLVNSEGDYLPGLTADKYNKTIVIRPLIKGIERRMDEITAAFSELYPEASLFIKRDEYTARKEDIQIKNGYVKGEGDGSEIIEENGLKFRIDMAAGQKTGFYLDQRDNRSLVPTFSKGKVVLNLFSYTAAFSVYAAKGGAAHIVSVDSSQGALALAEENVKLNESLDEKQFEFTSCDAFDLLKNCKPADLIILDPPPFARKKQEVSGAVKGYKFINAKALEKLNSNGILFTFSCSQAVSRLDFKNLLTEVCSKSGRSVRFIRELSAPYDHPFSPFHPEGEYLKGWIMHVL